MTSFTRIIIVLGLPRNVLGTPSMPPNQVMFSSGTVPDVFSLCH